MLKFFGKVVGVLFITLLLLELLAQLVWWGRDCVTFSEKELCLLPIPLLNEAQLEVLDELEEADKTGNSYLRFDSILGWSIRPNGAGTIAGTEYESNDIGVRASRSYKKQPPPGVTRLAVFGPSFAHADDVLLEDAWTFLMEESQPAWEVMNWGVPGFGTDQSLLRYEVEGAAYNPDVVLIVYEEENLRRNVNRYRPFFFPDTGVPLTKPVFTLEGEGLELVDNPFPSVSSLRETALESPNPFLDIVCPHDFFCTRERYQVSPFDILKSFRFVRTLLFEIKYQENLPLYTTWIDSYDDPMLTEVSLRILNSFAQRVREDGAIPIVLVFSYRGTLDMVAAGEKSIYDEFVQQVERSGIPVLDMTDEFIQANGDSIDFTGYYAPGGHYNEAGNRVVSDAAIAFLCDQGTVLQCSPP